MSVENIAAITAIVLALGALLAAIASLLQGGGQVLKAGGQLWKELTERVVASENQIEETNKRIDEQQRMINSLVETSMSPSAFHHLAGISLLRNYEYHQNEEVGELIKREFYFLKDRGFIGPRPPTSDAELEFNERLDGANVARIARPTEIGKTYIKLRKEDIPQEWLSPEKRENLKLDVVRDLGLQLPSEQRTVSPA